MALLPVGAVEQHGLHLPLDIDAYDQPAVETGKVATFGLMGRAGYEEWKQKVDAALRD